MEKTIVKLCPRCGRPMQESHDDEFDTDVVVCQKCDWRYYTNTEKYTFVTFRPEKKGKKPFVKKQNKPHPIQEKEEVKEDIYGTMMAETESENQ